MIPGGDRQIPVTHGQQIQHQQHARRLAGEFDDKAAGWNVTVRWLNDLPVSGDIRPSYGSKAARGDTVFRVTLQLNLNEYHFVLIGCQSADTLYQSTKKASAASRLSSAVALSSSAISPNEAPRRPRM